MADRNLSGRSIEEGHQSNGGVKFIQRDALHSNRAICTEGELLLDGGNGQLSIFCALHFTFAGQ